MIQIIFEELRHLYHTRINNEKVTGGLSVTTFVGLYKKPYQVDFWAIYTAVRLDLELERKDFSQFCTLNEFKFYKYEDNEKARIGYLKSCIQGKSINGKTVNWSKGLMYKEQVQSEWTEKKETKGRIGTEFHEFMEKQAHDNKEEFINKERVPLANNAIYQTKGLKYSVDLKTLEDGYHSEVLVYSDIFNINKGKYHLLITGQVDKLFIETIDGIRYVDLDDYKTNDKITVKNGFSKLLSPINHLEDTKLIANSLQLSLYARILEEHGFVVRNLYFTHHDIAEIGMGKKLDVDKIGKEYKKIYELNYYKYEIHSMIKDYCMKNNLKIEGEKFNIVKEYIL